MFFWWGHLFLLHPPISFGLFSSLGGLEFMHLFGGILNNHPPCVVLPVEPIPHPQREADALALFSLPFSKLLRWLAAQDRRYLTQSPTVGLLSIDRYKNQTRSQFLPAESAYTPVYTWRNRFHKAPD
jgi:hypothetical protein